MSLEYEAGDIILDNCDPFAKALLGEYRNLCCNNCFVQKGNRLKPCATCGVVKYCSEACRVQDLEAGHKLECESQCFRKYCQSGPSADVKILLFRMVAMLKLNPDSANKQFPLFNKNTRCFNDLMAQQKDVDKHIGTGYQSGEMVRRMNDEDPENKVEDDYFLRLVSISQTYSYGIYNDSQECRIGWGIFIEPSIFKHSCKPNAHFLNIGTKLQVRAIGPVPKGEQPLISYLTDNLSKARRNKLLQETYHFQCHCEICETESDAEVDYIRLNYLIREMKKLATMEVPVGNWEDIYKQHEEILKMLRQIYHEYDERITNQLARIVDIGIPLELNKQNLMGLFKETLDHLRITFGEDHVEYKEFHQDIAPFMA